MDRAGTMESSFGARRALIGVVHVDALPGTPQARCGVADVAALAVTDARAYASAGFDALILENMHDRPYLKGAAGPEIVAAMTAVAVEVRHAVPLPLGIQVLAGANCEAMAVAHACRAAFVRVEGFVFAHVADEGLIEACAGPLLRYRKAIGADGVRVFADIKKKHSAHAITGDVDLVETARAAEFFTADGRHRLGQGDRAGDGCGGSAGGERGGRDRDFGGKRHHRGQPVALSGCRRLDRRVKRQARGMVGQSGGPGSGPRNRA